MGADGLLPPLAMPLPLTFIHSAINKNNYYKLLAGNAPELPFKSAWLLRSVKGRLEIGKRFEFTFSAIYCKCQSILS